MYPAPRSCQCPTNVPGLHGRASDCRAGLHGRAGDRRAGLHSPIMLGLLALLCLVCFVGPLENVEKALVKR